MPLLKSPTDGRWVAALILAAFLAMLKMGSLARGQPLFEGPPFSWIGPMKPYFADLRGVASWSEQFCADDKRDVTRLRDPWNRPFNYHYWWLYSAKFGLNSQTVMAFGYGMGTLWMMAAFFVLGRLDLYGGLASGLFLISYAMMFGLERANVDLFIFTLLAVALAVRRWPPLSAVAIGLAAILKLHPVFAFPAMLVRPWRKTLPWLGAGLFFFAWGIMNHFHDFIADMSVAPNMRTGVLAFGGTALGLEWIEHFGRPDLYPLVLAISVGMLYLAAGFAAWIRPRIEVPLQLERELFAFRLGAGVYLGCFLMGTNHDYRAIVLLFCLPLLLRMVRLNLERNWARLTLLLILVVVNWLYLLPDRWPEFFFKQGVTWMLFTCLAALFMATLPPALRLEGTGRRSETAAGARQIIP
jgi:hypothetical protein